MTFQSSRITASITCLDLHHYNTRGEVCFALESRLRCSSIGVVTTQHGVISRLGDSLARDYVYVYIYDGYLVFTSCQKPARSLSIVIPTLSKSIQVTHKNPIMDSAGAKSKTSNDMKDLTHGEEDISHSVQGHKANLSNPSTLYAYLNLRSPSWLTIPALAQTPPSSRRNTVPKSLNPWAAMKPTTASRITTSPRVRRRTWMGALLRSRRAMKW